MLSSCKKDTDDRDQYVGTYNAEDKYVESGITYTENYSFTITKSSVSSDRIIMTGFAGAPGVSVEATVSGNNFTIPQQTIVFDGENIGISGSGSISGNSLTYSYSGSFFGITLNFTGIANKI
jgi:hypothetical protein